MISILCVTKDGLEPHPGLLHGHIHDKKHTAVFVRAEMPIQVLFVLPYILTHRLSMIPVIRKWAASKKRSMKQDRRPDDFERSLHYAAGLRPRNDFGTFARTFKAWSRSAGFVSSSPQAFSRTQRKVRS